MNSMVRYYGRWALLVMAIVAVLAAQALGGCAPTQTMATATPTKTPRPTFTRAAAMATELPATAMATKAPAATAPPTAAPTEPPTQAPTASPEPPSPTLTPVPPTATARPVEPSRTPAPIQPTTPPAPPAAADPCANIGGDGCKWRVTAGPSFGENGGLELKLQFIFLHSGEGGQTQGSYFVVLEKDGQKLPISDSVRSIGLSSTPGSLGKYNYEYILGVDKLPGNTLAGHYRLWVLDGNGERDSRNLEFDVPATSGLIWIQFDQA